MKTDEIKRKWLKSVSCISVCCATNWCAMFTQQSVFCSYFHTYIYVVFVLHTYIHIYNTPHLYVYHVKSKVFCSVYSSVVNMRRGTPYKFIPHNKHAIIMHFLVCRLTIFFSSFFFFACITSIVAKELISYPDNIFSFFVS